MIVSCIVTKNSLRWKQPLTSTARCSKSIGQNGISKTTFLVANFVTNIFSNYKIFCATYGSEKNAKTTAVRPLATWEIFSI